MAICLVDLKSLTTVKPIIRLFVALFGAVFGSLVISVQSCTYAAGQPNWPRWADFMCGHNVAFSWILTAPILFILTTLLLSQGLKEYRRHAVVFLAVLYSLGGLFKLHDSPSVWTTILPAVAFVAAGGIALRRRWGNYLVYALALHFAAVWVYAVCLGAISGYFAGLGTPGAPATTPLRRRHPTRLSLEQLQPRSMIALKPLPYRDV
jgi:hypothetical protein